MVTKFGCLALLVVANSATAQTNSTLPVLQCVNDVGWNTSGYFWFDDDVAAAIQLCEREVEFGASIASCVSGKVGDTFRRSPLVKGPRYSESSSDCFGEYAQCLNTLCTCRQDKRADDCYVCVKDNCEFRFESCSGYNLEPYQVQNIEAGNILKYIGGAVGGSILFLAIAGVIFMAVMACKRDEAARNNEVKWDNAGLENFANAKSPTGRGRRQGGNGLIGKNFTVMYDFDAQRDDELDSKSGDVVTIVDQGDGTWIKVKNIATSKSGLVPRNFLEENP